MKALVLDLRWNGGGMLDTAVGVADLFLDRGVIVSTKGRNDPEDRKEATAPDSSTDLPMVIIVNDRSASASEIVAGALQDQNRAIVLGERTFGKGSVQRIFPLNNGQCAVKLTVAKYYLPSGRCIHREDGSEVWGVDPLIEVKMSLAEYADVFRARRDSEILRVNGKAQNGDSDEQAPPKDEGDRAEPKDNGGAGAEPDGTGGDVTPKGDGSDANGVGEPELPPDLGGPAADKKPVEDKQLARAIDVLKMLPVVKRFGQDQPAAQAAK